MAAYQLILETGPPDAEWLLEWDDDSVDLKSPDGASVLEATPGNVHLVVEMFDLYAESKISFVTPKGLLTFKKQPAALAALRELVESSLAGDPEHCARLRQHSLRVFFRGLACFVIGGGLFGLYCWYSAWAPDPPRGHWIRWFGWLIHGVLLVLTAAGLGGPFIAYYGLRQWLRVRRIERTAHEFNRGCHG